MQLRRVSSELISDPEPLRCLWAKGALLEGYHDTEWGFPLHDERILFELLTLEGAQAGLSWELILRKRDGYRRAFAGFDPAIIASFGPSEFDTLLANPAIIRHRGKIESVTTNARAFIETQREYGSFDAWLWRFVDGTPQRTLRIPGEHPAVTSPLSDRVSKALRSRGFRFVGSTTVQAFLQAAGLLDDHDHGCFRHAIEPTARRSPPPKKPCRG